jgi:starvation-inducible DNA-binding protein
MLTLLSNQCNRDQNNFERRGRYEMSSAIGTEMKSVPLTVMVNEDTHEDTRKVGEALSNVLADTFTLYLKTHNFHWNVTGPMFHTLHLMFEEQYNELWLAGDAIAERIRALGCTAPGSYREFSKLTYLREPEAVLSATEMIAELLRDHETCARTARWALAIARTAVDAPTEDLLTQRLIAHEKTAWMLKSMLGEERPLAIRPAV